MKQIKALVEGVWKEFEPDELKGKSGVYKWTSPDGFWYVGQSCDLYRRHREFMNFAGDYSGELVNLERYKCPDPDKWVYEILEFTETEFDNDELEEHYISKFDPLTRLNMKIGGGEFLKLLLRYMKPGFKLLYNDFWRKYSSFRLWAKNYKGEMKFCIEHPAYEPIADEYKKLDKKVIELHSEFVKYRDILPAGELSNKQLVRIMLDYRSVDDNEIKSGLEKLFSDVSDLYKKHIIIKNELDETERRVKLEAHKEEERKRLKAQKEAKRKQLEAERRKIDIQLLKLDWDTERTRTLQEWSDVNLCDESKIRLYDDLVNKNFSNNTPNPLDTRITSDVLNNIVNNLDRDYTIFEDDIDYVKFIDVFAKCLDYIKQINNKINNQN